MHFLATPGTSVAEETARITTSVSKDLRAIPGVRTFGSHIGQAFLGEEVAGVNFGENWISIDENADYNKTIDAIRSVVNSYPGVYRDVLTYLNERIEEVLTGSKEPIVVRVYGEDLSRPAEQGPRDCSTSSPESKASSTITSTCQVDRTADRGRGGPGQGGAVRAEARRRPSGGIDPGRRRGSG